MISCDPFTERYVLKDSERGLYGDVHFYDYKHNGLLAEHYPNSRFVSGIETYPDTYDTCVCVIKKVELISTLGLRIWSPIDAFF